MKITFYDELIRASLISKEEFIKVLQKTLSSLRISMKEFSKLSGIPMSTLSKIFSEKRDLRLSTYQQIMRTIRRLIGGIEGKDVIAIIASESTLGSIKETIIKVADKEVIIRRYPVATMEEAIIAAFLAERDGVSAIVCAPIVKTTLERFIVVPIIPIHHRGESLTPILLTTALELAAKIAIKR